MCPCNSIATHLQGSSCYTLARIFRASAVCEADKAAFRLKHVTVLGHEPSSPHATVAAPQGSHLVWCLWRGRRAGREVGTLLGGGNIQLLQGHLFWAGSAVPVSCFLCGFGVRCWQPVAVLPWSLLPSTEPCL